MNTIGISPKAVLAAVVPALGGVVAVGVQWLVTGEFDRAELGTAVGTVAAAMLAFLGAYAGVPGRVEAVTYRTLNPAMTATTSSGSTGYVTWGGPAPAPGRPGEFDDEPSPPPESELRDLHENDET